MADEVLGRFVSVFCVGTPWCETSARGDASFAGWAANLSATMEPRPRPSPTHSRDRELLTASASRPGAMHC
eukprot:5169913-Lingulodinium_polyedra.AAC.1